MGRWRSLYFNNGMFSGLETLWLAVGFSRMIGDSEYSAGTVLTVIYQPAPSIDDSWCHSPGAPRYARNGNPLINSMLG